MNQNEMRTRVGEVCEAWSRGQAVVHALQHDLDSLADALASANSEIADLIADKRSAPREEKSYYRELISSAKERKFGLVAELRAKRVEMGQAKAALAATRGSERSVRKVLESELHRLSAAQSRIKGSPLDLASELGDLRQVVAGGAGFCQEQLRYLHSVFSNTGEFVRGGPVGEGSFDVSTQLFAGLVRVVGDSIDATAQLAADIVFDPLLSDRFELPSGADMSQLLDGSGDENTPDAASDDFVYIFDQQPWWSVLAPDSSTPLHLIDPPQLEPYLTVDGSRTVPSETYHVFDTIDVLGLSTEQKAVAHAAALLNARGHSVVLAIGGPGLADMISLDSKGQLWISEVKGTEVGGALPQSGLKRTLLDSLSAGDRGLTTMFENSPEWLLRRPGGVNRVDQVLDEIGRAIDASKDPARTQELRSLREKYREGARDGFSPLTSNNELIQVGFQSSGDYLPPPMLHRSKVFDEYIEAAEPSRIVQIDVVIGSAKSDIFERDSDRTTSEASPADTASASEPEA